MKRYTLLSLLLVLALVFTACAPAAVHPLRRRKKPQPRQRKPLPKNRLPHRTCPSRSRRRRSTHLALNRHRTRGYLLRGRLRPRLSGQRRRHLPRPPSRRFHDGGRHPARRRPASPALHCRRPARRDRQQRRRQPGHGALVAEGELLDLQPLFDAPSLDTPGKTFGETLFPGSQDAGKFDGVQHILLISYTVSGVWHGETYSRRWAGNIPKTWDEMLEFGDMVLETTDMYPWTYQGKFPQYMVFGVLMPLIYKNGGIEAIIAMDNLEEGAFSSDAVRLRWSSSRNSTPAATSCPAPRV